MPANPYAPPGAPLEAGKKRGWLKPLAWTAAVLLAIAGVFAAVAVPEHYARVYRSRVAQAVGLVRPVQDEITEHFVRHKKPPERVDKLPAGLSLGPGAVLTWTFPADAGDIGGSTIVFTPRADGDTLLWDCKGGTLPAKHRVHACR